MTELNTTPTTDVTDVSPEALAALGAGHIAYVKQIRRACFPRRPKSRRASSSSP